MRITLGELIAGLCILTVVATCWLTVPRIDDTVPTLKDFAAGRVK